MKRNQSGITLINLLIKITLVAALLATGLPAISTFFASNQANNTYYQIQTLIQFARIQSVNYRSQVLLCPTNNETDCHNNWNQPLMIFVDINNDEKRNANEPLLQTKPSLSKDEQIIWKASGSNRYLRFKPDGSTRNQNGRLSYCLTKEDNIYAWQIIMSMSGRQRKATEEEARSQC